MSASDPSEVRSFPALAPLCFKGTESCAPSLLMEGALADCAGERWGHFGLHSHDGDRHRLARDVMGVHKLFFTVDDGGVDNRPLACFTRAQDTREHANSEVE